MALTYSPGDEIGKTFPAFTLPSVDGKDFSSSSSQKPLLVMFLCNHCPYVKAIEDRLIALGARYKEQLQCVAVCSNDPTDHPEDLPENLRQRSQEKNYPFPYLVDADQKVARSFGAVCTPDLFLLDQNRRLFYRGRLDDAWKNPDKVTRQELKEAIEGLLAGKPAPQEQIPSMGCSIKWKAP
jgi:peroxiredoxin